MRSTPPPPSHWEDITPSVKPIFVYDSLRDELVLDLPLLIHIVPNTDAENEITGVVLHLPRLLRISNKLKVWQHRGALVRQFYGASPKAENRARAESWAQFLEYADKRTWGEALIPPPDVLEELVVRTAQPNWAGKGSRRISRRQWDTAREVLQRTKTAPEVQANSDGTIHIKWKSGTLEIEPHGYWWVGATSASVQELTAAVDAVDRAEVKLQ